MNRCQPLFGRSIENRRQQRNMRMRPDGKRSRGGSVRACHPELQLGESTKPCAISQSLIMAAHYATNNVCAMEQESIGRGVFSRSTHCARIRRLQSYLSCPYRQQSCRASEISILSLYFYTQSFPSSLSSHFSNAMQSIVRSISLVMS